MWGALRSVVLVASLMAGPGEALAQLRSVPPPVLPSPILPAIPTPPQLSVRPALPPGPGPTNEELSELYQAIAGLYQSGRYGEAVPRAKEYASKIEQRAGNEGLPYANAISLLSRLYQIQGQYDDAEPLLRHSLDILEHKGGAEGDIAIELDALAQLYDSQGRFDEAEPLYTRALDIAEKNAASDPRSFGRALNDLAWLYQEEGRYAEAEPRASKALDVTAKAAGTKDSDYGCTLDTLAKLYEGQDRKAEAELFYRQALAVLESARGPDDINTAETRENLGGLLKSLGQYAEAQQLLSRALATKEQVYGSNHPNLAKTLTQLGELYRLEGKPEEADPLFKRALEIRNGTLKEVTVFFATDRQREQAATPVLFGAGRSEVVTFGQATIVVPKPQKTAAPQRSPMRTPPGTKLPGSEAAAGTIAPLASTTELTRLAIRSVDVATSGPNLMRSAALKGEALVFVHGYNVTLENALRRAAQIAYDTKFDGPTFLFSWSSRGRLLDYLTDSDTTMLAADHLFELVRTIAGETKVKRIHFVAHSMGNLVLLRTLEKMAQDQNLRPMIGEIIDAAPDVDADVFTHMVSTIKTSGSSFTLYASRRDWALWAAGWLRGLSRAGFIGDKALIAPGVETIDVTEAGTSYFALNHDVYASNPVLVEDMQRIIERHEHPPDTRTKAFEPVASNEGTYWRFHRAEEKATASLGPALSPIPLAGPTAQTPMSELPAAPLPAVPVSPAEPTQVPSQPAAAAAQAPEQTPKEPPPIAEPPAQQAAPPAATATIPLAVEPKAETSPATVSREPTSQAASPPAVSPTPDAGQGKPATAKFAHRKKKRDDPDWNTKILH